MNINQHLSGEIAILHILTSIHTKNAIQTNSPNISDTICIPTANVCKRRSNGIFHGAHSTFILQPIKKKRAIQLVFKLKGRQAEYCRRNMCR